MLLLVFFFFNESVGAKLTTHAGDQDLEGSPSRLFEPLYGVGLGHITSRVRQLSPAQTAEREAAVIFSSPAHNSWEMGVLGNKEHGNRTPEQQPPTPGEWGRAFNLSPNYLV